MVTRVQQGRGHTGTMWTARGRDTGHGGGQPQIQAGAFDQCRNAESPGSSLWALPLSPQARKMKGIHWKAKLQRRNGC